MQKAVAGAKYGPKGFRVSDMAWVREVADRYGFHDLEIPPGSIVWEKGIKSIGGRCWQYAGGLWAIGLSYPRFLKGGREESTQTLAHELLHAYLWEFHRVRGHDANFKVMARARGIRLFCDHFSALDNPVKQMALF